MSQPPEAPQGGRWRGGLLLLKLTSWIDKAESTFGGAMALPLSAIVAGMALLVPMTVRAEAPTSVKTTTIVEGTSNSAVADAERRCEEATKGPAPISVAEKPIEKLKECIAAEAKKCPMRTREAICALGKSGDASGSTAEVYMSHGRRRTDHE